MMQTLPDFRIGIFNGWLPLTLYLVGFLLALLSFSRRVRARLFEDPIHRMPSITKFVRRLGQIAMLVYIGMMVFTPLKPNKPVFLIGILIYTAGYVIMMVALHSFNRAHSDQAVVTGPYRLSRNPQWIGVVLVLVGAAVMSGVLLYLGILLVVAIIYHLQILAEEQACLEQLGDSFRTYMDKVPRYFLFL
jgi:protein-S-isoprenylcysteine O-methyltransferase Ste14